MTFCCTKGGLESCPSGSVVSDYGPRYLNSFLYMKLVDAVCQSLHSGTCRNKYIANVLYTISSRGCGGGKARRSNFNMPQLQAHRLPLPGKIVEGGQLLGHNWP